MGRQLLIRLDAGNSIGSGHLMRCSAIVNAACDMGAQVLFAVANAESKAAIDSLGFDSVILGGDQLSFHDDDALRLAECADRVNATGVLVDSYAVNERFFEVLKGESQSSGFVVGSIDDMYLFEEGILTEPLKFSLDVIVNYGFASPADDYRRIYSNSETVCLIGPAYAPIRRQFQRPRQSRLLEVENILVTSGGTNPGRALERMVTGCLQGAPRAHIDVVVGPLAEFDEHAIADSAQVTLHRHVSDLSDLMLSADLAVTAAGSTLYELACMGVPGIALPIVENQYINASAFRELELGFAAPDMSWSSEDIAEQIEGYLRNPIRLNVESSRLKNTVDGMGAKRICEALLR